MNIWQIAAGEPHRYFDELFFQYGIMIIGPSHLGSALNGSYGGGKGVSKGNQVHAFANEVRLGDRVVIRKRDQIVGVGSIQIGAKYQFVEQFGCILGWDLCHVWNVSWAEDSSICLQIPNPFLDRKQIPTFTKIHNADTVGFITNLPEEVFRAKEFKLSPTVSKQLSYDELRLKLFQRGVASIQIENIVVALRQCRQLSDWYSGSEHSAGRPTEHEVVSHMVLPLLLALGWSHQQIAVEWNKVDVALFLKTPTTKENCVGIIEAKGYGQSLGDVFDQPKKYINSLPLTNVSKVIITDGPNLFIHNRDKHSLSFDAEPSGYINLTYLTDNYIMPQGLSAIEALIQMLPSQFHF
jgi:hypothetical protein